LKTEFNWKLVRERDGLTNQSKEVMWVEWNEDGRFKSRHDEPAVGRSLIMSPFNQFFTWQTTSNYRKSWRSERIIVNSRHKNSDYELWKTKRKRLTKEQKREQAINRFA
jgi:YD repeat-containing protein